MTNCNGTIQYWNRRRPPAILETSLLCDAANTRSLTASLLAILPTNCALADPNGGSSQANYVPVDRTTAKLHIDRDWWNPLGTGTIKRTDGDTWSWATIVGEARLCEWAEVIGVITADGAIQGAINYRTDGVSILAPHEKSVFIEHIACAPRNRRWICNPPNYCGVGVVLVTYAICHSYILGFGGRLTLVSLSQERSRTFYEKQGFTRVQEIDNGMIEFELTPTDAQEWLRRKGLLL